MQPLSRRTALLLGGAGAVATVTGAAGLLWGQGTGAGFQATGGQELSEPQALHSADGRLQVKLSAARGRVRVAGRDADVFSYNGSLPGPTLFLRPGDRLNVALENRLTGPTNLHVHGLHVSPEGNGDNPLVAVDPGTSFDYEYRLPAHHPPGVYWYHPHRHGSVADQIFGGLYGAIIVRDPQPIPVSRERVLVISDISLTGDGSIAAVSAMEKMMGREGNLILVNGQPNPALAARPGDRERWRIINACTARYLKLRLDGQSLQLLGLDSGRYQEPRNVEEVLLAPGNRADLLVTAAKGAAALRTLPADRGSMGFMMGGSNGGGPSLPGPDGTVLATFTVNGAPTATLGPVPAQPAPRDLRAVPVTAHRELVFAMGMGMGGGTGSGMMSFSINGRPFDPARVDTTVPAGAVEEWTLRNTSPMDHPMHLHVWPMQIIDQAGQPVETPIWQDVVNIPARSSVRVRIAFDDFTGKTVYHCHILDHEDSGMMGLIEAR
ncbi:MULTISPECIES: multicopper oxidase family protein [Paenarthrobacter]|jgi:FtsP/CotA-like multicopper oxidase with cupredoxin domain|uniref:Copper-containing nitrite reductase n=1 Tax=Paenarthrobacter ureafaciens TaxID=37931 RepID=A0AAX3EFC4_PAEUR|nr:MULTISPECIES: multicopper oxidase family protein [Paenarthrobacter]NKR12318.1 copper oxidase [Arthrobacter sp. M5]NKR15642.1 copper oxidase [Arthrobacter sp. M6]OEH62274.1 copper oxidase [Arthrobacter sp. D4]OEH62845.1 copper oxidase [Arthrobacter sp. D2]MDO5864999.1 multicopper oxidase family protein [Paenarthrobacter sp. SD-2]